MFSIFVHKIFNYILALVCSIILGTAGQILLKLGAKMRYENNLFMFLSPYTLVGLTSYFFAAIFFIFALKKIPISVAYSSSAIIYVMVVILSHFIFKESITINKFIGMTLICLGIYFIWK